MKTLKNLSIATFFILFCASGYSQDSYRNYEEPAVITLVSSKNIRDASEVLANLDGEIIIDTWKKESGVRIEMEIKASGITREVVKYLETQGRFVIEMQTLDDGAVLFSAPNLRIDVFINGIRLSEIISYRISVPENVSLKIRPTRG